MEEVVAIMCRSCVIISLFLKSAKTVTYIVIRATLNIAVAVVLCVCLCLNHSTVVTHSLSVSLAIQGMLISSYQFLLQKRRALASLLAILYMYPIWEASFVYHTIYSFYGDRE